MLKDVMVISARIAALCIAFLIGFEVGQLLFNPI